MVSVHSSKTLSKTPVFCRQPGSQEGSHSYCRQPGGVSFALQAARQPGGVSSGGVSFALHAKSLSTDLSKPPTSSNKATSSNSATSHESSTVNPPQRPTQATQQDSHQLNPTQPNPKETKQQTYPGFKLRNILVGIKHTSVWGLLSPRREPNHTGCVLERDRSEGYTHVTH